GQFSMFYGIDRSIVVLAGNGITLRIGDAEQTLHPGDQPIRFDGAATAWAHLVDGPVTDFNVMTNRDMVVHQVKRLQTGTIIDAHHLRAVFGLEPAMLQIDGEPCELGRWETFIDITA